MGTVQDGNKKEQWLKNVSLCRLQAGFGVARSFDK
jgi:hypothetical protein